VPPAAAVPETALQVRCPRNTHGPVTNCRLRIPAEQPDHAHRAAAQARVGYRAVRQRDGKALPDDAQACVEWRALDRKPQVAAFEAGGERLRFAAGAESAVEQRFEGTKHEFCKHGCFSVPVTDVQRDDTAAQIEVAAVFEARLGHHRGERFLIGVHANRFSQIAVARFVVRNNSASAGSTWNE